ncbi:hypothetical protein TRFO_03818 [Tritrichomonas foetus]|uniref:Uncharacterized protein n=1 Tax=Tritrichomonas foetus TaxID=1144522 RepID=A0A1J4KKG4_9EUKA|nr:hypothetical protein TRFO_03818 [Tritrichomonas foetus]|eukprot:OHT11626.1 hypothetical protein TRFO_03818 [Tritrichomonas foetus]
MSYKASSALIYKRLKDEYEKQKQSQKEMFQSQNEYYKNSKRLENQRHYEAMIQLEQDQARRVQLVRKQESQYHQQITEIRLKYATEKKKLERKYQHEMKMLEDSRFPIDKNEKYDHFPEIIPDAVYAEALISELVKMYNKDVGPKEVKIQTKNKKLHLLSDSLDAHFRLLHSLLNGSNL